MAEVLRQWLQEVGLDVKDLEQEFANGYLFGKLLHQYNLQPDITAFLDKEKPDAFIKNYAKLQPTLMELGIKLDTHTAQALIDKQPGLAAKVLYSIKQALDSRSKDFQAIEHAGSTIQQFGVRMSPTKEMLEIQSHKSQQSAYQTGNLKFFEDVMRKTSKSPNAMMESLHLKKFADTGSRQEAAAAEMTAAEEAMKGAKRAAFINSERTKLAAARADKATKLGRDKAAHAAILKHQDDLERQELGVEMALSELRRHKQQLKMAAAAADAVAGIDAFEMTLKRLGAEGGHDEMAESADNGESPATTLNRIRTFAPTAAKLAESGAEYLATIKTRRHEELAGRKEREARRKKLLIEQQAARTAAEQRVEADALLEVLVRRSAEEQKLGQRLWQLRQEKAAMEADRQLREEQYAARRDKDWEESIRREIHLNKSMKAQHDAAMQQELAAWREQQQQRAAGKSAAHTAMAHKLAWQMVQLAERVIEYRAVTAGQKVPNRDWRAWLALFTSGDPSLGSPIVTQSSTGVESETASSVIDTAELQHYLAGQGEWAAAPDVAGNKMAVLDPTAGSTIESAAAQHRFMLGRIVAELAAFAQKLKGRAAVELPTPSQETPAGPSNALEVAAADAASQQVDSTAQTIRSIPLKVAVTGGPFSGKSTTARTIAQKYGLKLLVTEQLVADAVAAAQAWEQQQQQQQQQQVQEQPALQTGSTDQQPQALVAAAAGEPSQHVLLGQRALQELKQGTAVSDQLLVELLLLAMVEVKGYVAPPPEPLVVETKPGKGSKAASKNDAAASANRTATSFATSEAAFAVPLPAHLAAGTPGRGFVIDGFPANAAQAMLLEKALTGLDTSAEQALVDGASVVAPPPPDALPQLQRSLTSGLDAVMVLGCEDESIAIKRALGRRLDPTTGRIYHLDFDPPPASQPGLAERLVAVCGADNDTMQVPQRLASYTAAAEPLSQWLTRFSTLRRPLDGTAELTEVLAGASDVASGILVAKGAAHAAQSAAEAAQRARESAEKAHEFAQAAQGHAEGAARQLLSAKKAEIQATALLTGGKNPDPASAEILKTQAAAKCADQLKVCRAAANDAAHHAERAHASFEQAAAAVQRCKLAVGDAAVSADAEAAASKAAADAETAASAAADAAKKAEAAKHLSETYVAEAEKLCSATDVPADAAIPSAQQLAADSGPAASGQAGSSNASASLSASVAASAVAAGSVSTGKVPAALPSPGHLPAALIPTLAQEWQVLEQVYVQGMSRGFSGLRRARQLALNHVARSCSWFQALLKRGDNKQQMLQSFIERFNAVELDMRKAKETQGELLLRSEELRDALWAVCDVKHDDNEAARLKLANDGSAAQHVELLGQHLTSLVQVEFDRFLSTCQFLFSYCHYSQSIYHVPGGDKPLCPLPTALTAAATVNSKPETAAKGAAPPPPAYIVALQLKLPQLATALKAAGTAAAATHTSALAIVDDVSKKAVAAAANAAAAINTAAAVAAAAAGGAAGAATAAHRPAASSAKGTSIAPTPAAAATGKVAGGITNNSKLGLTPEEAALAAAAAAAAVAALPDPSALAAVSAMLQNMLSQEVQLLQQRLALLGSKAAVIIEEVVQLQATANGKLAEWQQRRYVAECGAVSALEKILKAAAVAGQPLACDLRLEDEFLVVDESQLLVPPAPVAPAPRPASPASPPGVLRVQQLQQLSAALQQAATGGFIALVDAVELMMKMTNQGILPKSWVDIDVSHMTAALATLDPTYSGYLDWRELLLSLAAASIPSIHTASAAQVAAQAAQLAAVDSDMDGYVTQQEFRGVTWWFEPQPEKVQAAQEAIAAAAAADRCRCGQDGQHVAAASCEGNDESSGAAEGSCQWAEDILHDLSRCKLLKELLWDLFKQTMTLPVEKPAAVAAAVVAGASSPAATAAGPASPKTGKLAASQSKASSGSGSKRGSQSEGSVSAPAAAAVALTVGGPTADGEEAGGVGEVCSSEAVLLYLCADRDLYQGITKAIAAVTANAAAGTAVDAAAVVRLCYPWLTPEEAAPIQRAPLSASQITAAVAAASAEINSTAGAGAAAAPTASHSSSGMTPAQVTQTSLPIASLKPSQLMYGAACERVVTLMLQRYQWKDIYIAARL